MGEVLKFPSLEEIITQMEPDDHRLYMDKCWPHVCTDKTSSFKGMQVWLLRGRVCDCGAKEDES